jgi:NAD(P)-dependent dehydrogenase (short-subunit alcohol dehydrogenase family)
MDVTDEEDIEAAVEKSLDEFGQIDFLINNAGIWDLAPAIEMEESEWDKMMDINLKGVWLCAKHVGKHMIDEGEGGRIINISSNAGLVGWKNSSHYAASKPGVIGLTKTLALEFADHDITVNAICPGSVDTEMPTTGIEEAVEEYRKDAVPNYTKIHGSLNLFDSEGTEPLDPDEISSACLWLSSRDASFITGIALPVDGGFMAK